MKVRVQPRGSQGRTVLDVTARHHPPELHVDQYLLGMSEHDLRDLEFVLAQRRAMGKTCDEENGEHTCALATDDQHPQHLCRGCTSEWPRAPGT